MPEQAKLPEIDARLAVSTETVQSRQRMKQIDVVTPVTEAYRRVSTSASVLLIEY